MGRHEKTRKLIEVAREILADHSPMTLRQVYYQLVSRQVIENNRSSYQAVSDALVDARKEGIVPWAWMEDRLRRPRHVLMWKDMGERVEHVLQFYRRDVWPEQCVYLEVWLEKDALSGIFEDTLRPYGVTLNVGRGYDGWDSIHNAADRYHSAQEYSEMGTLVRACPVTILYFGDFDPSGEDMARSLRERLADFDSRPDIVKCALTREDIDRYHLPPDLTKPKDTRSKAFVEKHGNISVELDALPIDVLRKRIVSEVEGHMDLEALERTRQIEIKERETLALTLKTHPNAR